MTSLPTRAALPYLTTALPSVLTRAALPHLSTALHSAPTRAAFLYLSTALRSDPTRAALPYLTTALRSILSRFSVLSRDREGAVTQSPLLRTSLSQPLIPVLPHAVLFNVPRAASMPGSPRTPIAAGAA